MTGFLFSKESGVRNSNARRNRPLAGKVPSGGEVRFHAHGMVVGCYVTRGDEVFLVGRPGKRNIYHVPLGGRVALQYLEGMVLDERMALAMALLRPARSASRGGSPLVPVDPECVEAYPSLLSWLSDDSWADGEARQRSTLLVVIEGDQWKACVIDKDSDATLWASARTLGDLLAAMEARLTDPDADWRRRLPPQGRKRA